MRTLFAVVIVVFVLGCSKNQPQPVDAADVVEPAPDVQIAATPEVVLEAAPEVVEPEVAEVAPADEAPADVPIETPPVDVPAE